MQKFLSLALVFVVCAAYSKPNGTPPSFSSSAAESNREDKMPKNSANSNQHRCKSSVVMTESGLVSGINGSTYPNITVFKGIPYAAAPVGTLRWRDPKPPPKWKGVRTANAFGSVCAQVAMKMGPNGPTTSTQTPTIDIGGSEDCLYLNIWTGNYHTAGALGQNCTKARKLRPVYVWIHGGGYGGGSGSDTAYDGEGLAKKGLVVVTLNYRLSVLGFLATPALSQESGRNSSGNYGLLDQIAALKWVQRNIRQFGGDPNGVTIGGQSAGAGSCLILALSPLAKGLFRGAIPESGGVFFTRDPEISGLPSSHRNLSSAEQLGLDYLAYKNISANLTLEQLRNVSLNKLISFGMFTIETDPFVTWNGAPPMFRPVLDGYVIARTYQETLEKGLQNNVAIMTGNNHDEWGATPSQYITLSSFRTTASEKYGNLSAEFLTLYPASNDSEAGSAKNDAIRDNSRTSTFLWSQQWMKHGKKPVFTYFWTHALPGQSTSSGASHGSEMPYFFGNLYTANSTAWSLEDYHIAETMSNYVVNFVSNGNPNGPSVPEWPADDGKTPVVMEVEKNYNQIAVAQPMQAKVNFLKRFYATQQIW